MKLSTFLRKSLFLSIFLMTVTFLFAQGTAPAVEEAKSITFYLKSVLLTGVVGQIAVLFADAYKHLGVGWSWAKFLESKLKPFIFVQITALVIILVLYYLPELASLLDFTAGINLDTLTVTTLFATATALVDGILKRYKK